MRVPPRTQTGNIGASEVTVAFERLNWGVVDNSRHDVGTDLLLMARDERGFELCLLVGVQVKTRGIDEGPGKYFSEPVLDVDSETVRGWWFRDNDRRHIDSWLRYEIPHLLVLHDANTSVSYWVHITQDAVVPTKKGAKVFVPAGQTIDLEHREQLLAVAVTQRPGVEWEGSSWRGPESLPPSALLRHALIVPRLVAPHPNLALAEPLSPEQALALLVRVQVNDLCRRLDLDPLDEDLVGALARPGWGWQLARALLHRLTTGEAAQLLEALEAADNATDRTAATVVAAATLLEEGNADRANRLVAAALDRDDADPVDHAWLSLQHARCLGELGRLDEAREHALVAQSVRNAYPDDLTASAIGGIGAMTLYRLTRWGEGKLAEGVSGLDTTAVWWRALDTSDGLRASSNQAYRTWGRDTAITWGARDTAHDDLLATSLMAGYLGDQGAWSSLTALLAKENLRRLDRHSDAGRARAALATLRLSGDHKSTKLATRRFVRDGPVAAAAQAASECDLDTTTRSTARSSFTLLREAGDVLDLATAERVCSWLLDTLDDPTAFVVRTQPGYLLEPELVDTLTGIVGATSEGSQQRVAERVADLPPKGDQLHAQSWANLARALPRASWDAVTAARLGAKAMSHHNELRVVAHQIAATHDPAEREALLPLVSEGSQPALSAFGDVRELPADTVRDHIELLVTSCTDIRERAKNLSRTDGGGDRPADLALLNAWHPEQARWEPLLHLLADPLVWPKDKNGALRKLARLDSQVPDPEKHHLREIAERLLVTEPPPAMAFFGGDDDSIGAALELAYSIADRSVPVPVSWRNHLLNLLAGDLQDRRWAACIARHDSEPSGAGLLAALLHDEHPVVRAEATCSLIHRAKHETDARSLVDVALDHAIRDPGTVVAQNIVNALSRSGDAITSARRNELLQRLEDHPSATVRTNVTAALHTTETANGPL